VAREFDRQVFGIEIEFTQTCRRPIAEVDGARSNGPKADSQTPYHGT
jgi:hypothetical protein